MPVNDLRTGERAGRYEEYGAAAALRAEMALELGEDFDADVADWRSRYCAFFSGKQQCGKAQLYLAIDQDVPIGMAIVSLAEHYRTEVFGTRIARVNSVYVRPAYRRRGIARRLTEMAIAWARERKCCRVTLGASDQGRPLYELLGFRPAAEMVLPLS